MKENPAAAAARPVPRVEAPAIDGMRLRLLEIAERLFAELGVENTPLQRIVEESGQRNRSALNYHFGSRRDLLSALLDLRKHHLNELRHGKLDALEAAGLQADVAALTRAMYEPLVEVIRDLPWGSSYIQVLAQVMFNPSLAAHELISADHSSAMRRGRDLLGLTAPPMPADALVARVVWATDVVVHSLARWCRDGLEGWNAVGPMEDMIDFVTGGLLAPVSVLPAARTPLKPALRGPSGVARWL